MNAFSSWLQENLGLEPQTQERLLESLIVILVLWLLKRIAMMVVRRRTEDVRVRYRWRKTLTYLSVTLGFLWVGRIWFHGLREVGTFLGLLGAGLAIALKDVIANLAGWVFLIWRRPFSVGDRVQIGTHAGDVIDQRIFQFTLMEIGNWVDADQSTGRIIHVPNGRVLSDPLTNYTQGFEYIWNEIEVCVTFESDWRRAKEILERLAAKHSERITPEVERRVREAAGNLMISDARLTPVVYVGVRDNGVRLTIRHLCAPRQRRPRSHAIWEDVLSEFGGCEDIAFAYPTTRFYDRTAELPHPSPKDPAG